MRRHYRREHSPPHSTSSGKAADPASGGSPRGGASSGLVRVLMLEDDADTREVLGLLLCAEEGFVLEAYADVDACLERLAEAERGGSSYDVLLLDILLPNGRSGIEVLEFYRARPQLRLPPVVVCSAVSPSDLAHHRPVIEATGAVVVPKPFDAGDLIATLRAAAQRGHQR
jgi:CheY-like chemotaxis protein